MALTKKQMCCYAVLVVLFLVFAAKQTFAVVGGVLGNLTPACGVEAGGCPKPCLLLVHALLFALVACLALGACNKVEGYVRVRAAKERYAKAKAAKERYVKSRAAKERFQKRGAAPRREGYCAPSGCASCSR
tara:strand:+ start:1514 stop:1909 length:396 start_codon:yes stop_codon:yes gene_type:complete